MEGERLLSVGDVADRLKVTEDTVRRWLREGRLQAYRLGGGRSGWRISEADLRRFLESTRRPEGQEG